MKKLNCTVKELVEQHKAWKEEEKTSLNPNPELYPEETLSMYRMEKGLYKPCITSDGYIVRQAGETWTNNMNLNNPIKRVGLGDYDKAYDEEGEYKILFESIIEVYDARGGDHGVLFYEKAE